MILPSKHVPVSRSLIWLGGLILESLETPRTVSGLWETIRRGETIDTFEQLALALAFLYATGMVDFDGSLLRRSIQ